MAVISKILMEGIGASGKLFGEYVEKYVHTEIEVDPSTLEDNDDDVKKQVDDTCFTYNVTNLSKVIFLQAINFLAVPIKGIMEVFHANRDIFNRDYKRKFWSKFIVHMYCVVECQLNVQKYPVSYLFLIFVRISNKS